jgi:adenylate cyclase
VSQATEVQATRTSAAWPVAALFLGAGLLALLLLHPGIDEAWENHPAHFWLVFGAASLSVGLGYAVGVAARRRRDARLFLVSLAFISAAGFLGLHALATPGVLLGKNGASSWRRRSGSWLLGCSRRLRVCRSGPPQPSASCAGPGR